MKVKELIDKLQELDPELEVEIYTNDSGSEPLSDVDIMVSQFLSFRQRPSVRLS